MEDDLLYSCDHPRVVAELQRLQSKKAKAKSKEQKCDTQARWKTTHAQLATDCFLPCVSEIIVEIWNLQSVQNKEVVKSSSTVTHSMVPSSD